MAESERSISAVIYLRITSKHNTAAKTAIKLELKVVRLPMLCFLLEGSYAAIYHQLASTAMISFCPKQTGRVPLIHLGNSTIRQITARMIVQAVV